MNLIDFAEISKGLDMLDKIKLILFASKAKPATFVKLRINPRSLGEKYQFDQVLKKEGVIFIAGRDKSYEVIKSINGNRVRWEFEGVWIGYDLFWTKKDRERFLQYSKLIGKQPKKAHLIAGRLYGYPECCIKQYVRETPDYIKKHYSCYEYYSKIQEGDQKYPYVFHQPCKVDCKATIALNKKYESVVKKQSKKIWRAFRSRSEYAMDLIIDSYSDITIDGKTIWPEKDGFDYAVITKGKIDGYYQLISFVTKRYFERGTVFRGKVLKQYHYAKIKVDRIKDVIVGLHHERKHPLIGRKY